MTSKDDDAGSQDVAADNSYPGYCEAHAAAAAKYKWPFTPNAYPGRPNCSKPDDFDVKTQPHLAAAQKGD